MDVSEAGWVEECSGCGETPGGWVGKGNRWMGEGGRNEGRNREKYKASLRGGQTILIYLSERAAD